jgi:iron(III) transport system substrate-binding protein
MKPKLVRLVTTGATALALLAACGGTAAPPSAAPTSSAVAAKPASAASSASPSAKPASAGAAAASPAGDWQKQWDDVVAAAKQEKKVVVSGPASPLWRTALTDFQKDDPDIEVEYNGGDSRDFWPRLEQERKGGQYPGDVRIGGPDPQVFAAIQTGVLDPVRPLLILPEVNDESKWLGGWQAFYADKAAKYLPGFLADVSKPVYVNRDALPEPQLQTEQDLLKPDYKGKIVLQDPRGGTGLGFLTTFLKVDGEPFVRQLLAQNLTVSGDNRQIAEWIVRSRNPVAIGLRNYDLLVFQQQGLGQNVKSVDGVKAQPLSIGSGGIQFLNRAPQPKATQVLVNWLLTAKVQKSLTTAVQQNSRRLDVAPGAPDEVVDPKNLDQYVAHQTEELLPLREQAVKIAAEMLK